MQNLFMFSDNCRVLLSILPYGNVILTVNTICCYMDQVTLCLVIESCMRGDYVWMICCDNLWYDNRMVI
jgi:hypothetical protein